MSEGSLIIFCIGSFGILFLTMGILIRLGIWRNIHAVKGYPVYMPRALVFAYIPMGLTALSLSLILMLPPVESYAGGDLLLYLLLPLLLSTYVLAIWQPGWLKPTWLRWLEKEHGDILELLWEDVRQDKWGWERQVRIQKELEAWVEEVRWKHGMKGKISH